LNTKSSNLNGSAKTNDRKEDFFRILKPSWCKVLAIIKGHPDPDSIASTLAFKYLAKHLNIETDIDISPKLATQKQAMVKTLEIEL
jgi:nanoRNase/pAp phosphatase (c-di-AMP/oligoRNAs hydrolase)